MKEFFEKIADDFSDTYSSIIDDYESSNVFRMLFSFIMFLLEFSSFIVSIFLTFAYIWPIIISIVFLIDIFAALENKRFFLFEAILIYGGAAIFTPFVSAFEEISSFAWSKKNVAKNKKSSFDEMEKVSDKTDNNQKERSNNSEAKKSINLTFGKKKKSKEELMTLKNLILSTKQKNISDDVTLPEEANKTNKKK